MKRLRALPTWALTNAFTGSRLVPEKHPWHGRWFTLPEWYRGQTPECRMFDWCLWWSLLCLLVVLHTLKTL